MGLHCGYLAADMTWEDLLARLKSQAGDFIDLGIVADPESLPSRQAEGYGLFVREVGGKSYVLDTHLALSNDPDLVAFLAADSGAVVVGFGAETVSGSYWFIAARGRILLRHYHAIGDAGPGFLHPIETFDRGEPFPSEAAHPLDDGPGLEGQRRAVHALGFEDDAIGFDTRPPRAVTFTESVLPPFGPLARDEEEHFRRFSRPPDSQDGWLRCLFRWLARTYSRG
jgi:hypothetical protein